MKGGRTVSKLVTIVCAALLTLSPWSTASAQANVFGQTPSTGWQKAKLSQAIVNDANQAVENLVIANESGHITASDFDNAATSLQIFLRTTFRKSALTRRCRTKFSPIKTRFWISTRPTVKSTRTMRNWRVTE